MNKCTNCNKYFPEHVQFCSVCGSPLEKKKDRKMIWIICGALFVLLIIVVGLFCWNHFQGTDDKSQKAIGHKEEIIEVKTEKNDLQQTDSLTAGATEALDDLSQSEGNVATISDEKIRRKRQIIGGSIILASAVLAIIMLTLYFNSDKNTSYQDTLKTANKYLQEMDYEKAEASYLEAIRINPKDEEAYIKLSQLYVKQGKYKEAQEILETGKKATDSPKIKKKLGHLNKQGSTTKSIEKDLFSKTQLADLGTFPDDESNQLGLISSWEVDVDGDGVKEVRTLPAD